MNVISARLWIGFSGTALSGVILSVVVLGAALTACTARPYADLNPICTLRPIAVSEAVRTHLRAPLLADTPPPEGYGTFLRDIAAHNAKMATHCPATP